MEFKVLFIMIRLGPQGSSKGIKSEPFYMIARIKIGPLKHLHSNGLPGESSLWVPHGGFGMGMWQKQLVRPSFLQPATRIYFKHCHLKNAYCFLQLMRLLDLFFGNRVAGSIFREQFWEYPNPFGPAMVMPDLSLRKILRRLLILDAPQVAQLIPD